MRPVNLIPPEERRGQKAALRTGPLSYVVVSVLAVALIGVTLVVMTDNQVSDRKAEVATLQSEVTQTQEEATRLSTFADFASLQQARQDTVTTLATSRFDWERVLRELAIVIPSDVWLTNLTATASPGAGSSSTSSDAAGDILGPSLDIQGCADGHEAVARFLASLRDVDGVTRVTVMSSDRQDSAGSSGSSTSPTGGSGAGCSSRDFIASFEVIAAFDAVPTSSAAPAASTASTVPAATEPTAPTSSSTDQSQISDAQQQLQQQKDSAAEKTAQGRKNVDTFIPGTGSTP